MATLDDDSADDDELSCSVSTADKSDGELDELDELDEPASPAGKLDDASDDDDCSELELNSLDELASPAGRAGRLLELADSELEEDEAVSELELACPAAVSDEDWDEASLDELLELTASELDELST